MVAQARNIDLTWFPNSWVRIRSRDMVIYIDPAYLTTYFSGYADKTEFSKWPNPIDGLPNGLEKADFIFITHHHKDHCKKVTIKRLSKNKIKIFAPASCRPELGSSFRLVEPGDILELNDNLDVQVLNAYNTETGSSTRKQHKKGKGVGYILRFGDFSVYHAGDTDLIPDMQNLGTIDVALIPIGGKFTMDLNEAVKTTETIQPKIVIPIHHLTADPEQFCQMIQEHHFICKVPTIGQPIKLKI